MQAVELMIAVSLLIEVIIVSAGEQLAVAFDDGLDDFEEGEVFSFPFAEVLAVELDELEEDALDERLGVLAAALLVEQGHQAIEDEAGRNVVVPEVDELEHSPGIEDGQRGLADPKQFLMQRSPLLKGVIALLHLVLVLQDDLLQLVLLDALHLPLLRLFLHQ